MNGNFRGNYLYYCEYNFALRIRQGKLSNVFSLDYFISRLRFQRDIQNKVVLNSLVVNLIFPTYLKCEKHCCALCDVTCNIK